MSVLTCKTKYKIKFPSTTNFCGTLPFPLSIKDIKEALLCIIDNFCRNGKNFLIKFNRV